MADTDLAPVNTGEIQDTRNPDGTFKEGASGNPTGRPLGARNYSTLYREGLKKLAQMNNMAPEELEEEIMANGVKLARAGDYRFYRDHLDREHGKPTQRIVGDIDLTHRETVDTAAIKELTKALNEVHRRGGSTGDGGTASPVDTEAQGTK